MLSLPTALRCLGLFLLANAAYSRYELNQLAFIVSENTSSTSTRVNTLPTDIVLEILAGSLILLVSTLASLFTPTAKSASSICNDSTLVTLKNGNWIIDSRSNLQHPLRFIDIDRANTQIENAGKGSYAYLDNRANFANLTKRALHFQNWHSSSATTASSAISNN